MAAPAPLTLLDVAAHAPAAAARIAGALGEADRKALRLAHPALRDAVAEVVVKLDVWRSQNPSAGAPAPARPPTARRWPALEELAWAPADAATLRALGAGTWARLESLSLSVKRFGANEARALAALAPRMPALRRLAVSDSLESTSAMAQAFAAAAWPALEELRFCKSGRGPDEGDAVIAAAARAAPRLRALHWQSTGLPVRALAASGWRLEELLLWNADVAEEGVAALVAAPSFALRKLELHYCRVKAPSLRAIASAAWPLEHLVFDGYNIGIAEDASALAALARFKRLRHLSVLQCGLTAAAFKAVVSAAWPALTTLNLELAFVGITRPPLAVDAASFAGLPLLEELALTQARVGAPAARALARQAWPHLRELRLEGQPVDEAALAELARGAWPALRRLHLSGSRYDGDHTCWLTLAEVRLWAPALEELAVRQRHGGLENAGFGPEDSSEEEEEEAEEWSGSEEGSGEESGGGGEEDSDSGEEPSGDDE